MAPIRLPLSLLAALWLAAAAQPQNCTRTSTGLVPISDLGQGKYQGYEGGFYPGGSNAPPSAHLTAGLAEAKAIQPLDAAGQPSPTGKIVLVSIGMSNTTQEFSTWVPISNGDPRRRGTVVVVDGAQGGQDAKIVADPTANFWNVVNQRLANAGATPQQVQAAWLKEAMIGPTAVFPGHAQQLAGYLVQIAQNLRAKYPNLRLCYVSSRTYAGYATTALNPEPFAYESAFSVKWLIEQQINGDKALNFDPGQGAVVAPWLAWGPYLWADGTKGRQLDSLVYVCSDFQSDGTHPSTTGRQKVAALLDQHFTTDPTSTPWYFGPGSTRAAILLYGQGCPGSVGQLQVRNNGLPVLGSTTFVLGMTNARPSSPAALYLSAGRASLALDAACTLLVDPTKLLAILIQPTDANGRDLFPLPIPNDDALLGARVAGQFLVLDTQAPGLRLLGGGALSQGADLTLGR